MKKVLIFNGYYYPSKKCGGPITSIENIVNTCCDEFDFYIICYNHDFNDRDPFEVVLNTWVKVGNANVMYVEQDYLDFSKDRMTNLFEEIFPDLIWFSGVLTPNNKIIAVKLARKMKIPVLFSPRGELSADRVKLKAYKKVPYLRLLSLLGTYKNCYFHGTSDDEEEGIKKYFHPDQGHMFRAANISITQRPQLINYTKKKDELKVFFFSRIHEVKNVLFAVQSVCNCKKKIVFDIYGPIESEEYWNRCLEYANNAPTNITINYGGILDYTNKDQTIQEHDCFLFPTVNENYGHVIAESLANSRPVILSKGTTPWDDLDGKAGFVICLDKQNIFTEKLDYLASMTESDYVKLISTTSEYFTDKTSRDDAVMGHKKMLRCIIKENCNE